MSERTEIVLLDHASGNGHDWANTSIETFLDEQFPAAPTSSNGENSSVSSAVSTLVLCHDLLSALCHAGRSHQQRFLDAIRRCPNVVKVLLKMDDIPTEEAGDTTSDDMIPIYIELGQALGAMVELETLGVVLVDLTMINLIAHLLIGVKQISRLEWTCRMTHNNDAANEATSTHFLLDCLKIHENLFSVKVDAASEQGMAVACEMFAQAPNLVECEFGSSTWTNLSLSRPNHVEALVRVMASPFVIDVRLRMISMTTETAADAFCTSLATITLGSLTLTKLAVPVTRQRLYGQALSKASLLRIAYEDCVVDSELLVGMADAFHCNQTLEIIDFGQCRMHNNESHGLVSLLRQVARSSNLKTLCPPTCTWTRPLDAAWGNCLQHGSLRKARIVGRNDGIAGEPFTDVANAISQSKTLDSLHFDVSNVHDKDYGVVADAVGACTSLKCLTVCFHQWTADSLISVLHKIRNNKNLKSLTFEVDYFLQPRVNSYAAVAAIVEVAKKCFHLTTLRLVSHDELCDPLEWELNRSLSLITRLNEAGRKYLLEKQVYRGAGLRVLEAVNDDLSCIFLHMTENPQLCEIGGTCHNKVAASDEPERSQRQTRKALCGAFSLLGLLLNYRFVVSHHQRFEPMRHAPKFSRPSNIHHSIISRQVVVIVSLPSTESTMEALSPNSYAVMVTKLHAERVSRFLLGKDSHFALEDQQQSSDDKGFASSGSKRTRNADDDEADQESYFYSNDDNIKLLDDPALTGVSRARRGYFLLLVKNAQNSIASMSPMGRQNISFIGRLTHSMQRLNETAIAATNPAKEGGIATTDSTMTSIWNVIVEGGFDLTKHCLRIECHPRNQLDYICDHLDHAVSQRKKESNDTLSNDNDQLIQFTASRSKCTHRLTIILLPTRVYWGLENTQDHSDIMNAPLNDRANAEITTTPCNPENEEDFTDNLDAATPLSRAYYKLQEVWTDYGLRENSEKLQLHSGGGSGLDIGASPGGWTQVMVNSMNLSNVVALDPARLAKRVIGLPQVTHVPSRLDDESVDLSKHGPFRIVVCDASVLWHTLLDVLLQSFARINATWTAPVTFVVTMKLPFKTLQSIQRQIRQMKERVPTFAEGLAKILFPKRSVRCRHRLLHLMANSDSERTLIVFFMER
ncbi:hypothetical protein MPSEU_000040000 [Mayamaea pseudoterrestris]|nr:hypothetical protein MPSEU_000040000 [Mayamaea pseudoterrestris]